MNVQPLSLQQLTSIFFTSKISLWRMASIWLPSLDLSPVPNTQMQITINMAIKQDLLEFHHMQALSGSITDSRV